MLEAPKKAIGLGFNAATIPLRVNRWAARMALRQVGDVYRRATIAGQEQAEAIILDIPAHNAHIGAEALSKVPIVEELLDKQAQAVEELRDMGAEPIKVEAAIRQRRKLQLDLGILRATGYGMLGKSLQQIVRNDVPAEIPADSYPPGVETTVLDVAVESHVEPAKLDLPGSDRQDIATRLGQHKEDFM